MTPSEYLARHPTNQVATPSASSWDYKGSNEVWVDGTNDRVYRHLHLMGERHGGPDWPVTTKMGTDRLDMR